MCFFGADYSDTVGISYSIQDANITLNGTDGEAVTADNFGYSVSSGDINNDSYADVIVGAIYADAPSLNDAGQAYIFFGADFGTTVINENATEYANITINGSAANDYLGYSVTSKDVNNDDYSDIIIGAYGADVPGGGSEGQVYVFYGANYADSFSQTRVNANITLNGTAGDRLGDSVSSGDVNNDTYNDVITGATDGEPNNYGQVYVFYMPDVAVPVVNLELPEDNITNITTNTIDFTYNVSDFSSLANCSLIIENTGGDVSINVTDAAMQKDTAGQNLTTYLYNGEYNWTINYTDSIGNIGASETRNLSVNYPAVVYGWLDVNITYPPDPTSLVHGETFTINATVTCQGGAGAVCGTLNASARYNLSSLPDTDITTSQGATPFYILRDTNLSDGFSTIAAGTDSPRSIAFDNRDNTLWVIDYNDYFVYHFDTNGANLSGGFSTGSDPAYNIYGIAFDTTDNTFWITDNSRFIFHFDANGANLSGGFETNNNAGLYYPRGITIDTTDNSFWVASDDDY